MDFLELIYFQAYQICTAHLLRELNYFEERYNHQWPVKFRKFILDGIECFDSYRYFRGSD